MSKSPQAIKYYNELFAEEGKAPSGLTLRDYKQEHEANTATMGVADHGRV